MRRAGLSLLLATALVLGAGTVAVFGCTYAQDFEAAPVAADASPGDAGVEPAPASEILGDGGCDTQSDEDNCGVCGHSCLGGACLAGHCQAVVLASGLGDSGGLNGMSSDGGRSDGPQAIAADATHAYFIRARSTLSRVPVAGGPVERVADVPGDALVVTADTIYVKNWAAGLARIAKSGGVPTPVAPPRVQVYDFALDGDDVLLVGPGGPERRALYRCKLPACPATLPAPLYEPPAKFAIEGVAVSGRWAFVASVAMDGSREAHLQKIDARTGEAVYLIGRDAARYSSPVADDENVYTSNYRALISSPIDPNPDSSATGDKYLASGEDVRVGVIAGHDERFVYWHEPWGPRRIVRCAKSGCTTPDVLWVSTAGAVPTDWWGKPGAPDGAMGLAVTDDALYFTTGDGKVMKLAKPPRERPAAPPL